MELQTILFYSLVFIFTFIYGLFKYKFNYWARRNVPFIKPTIPFGNIEGFRKTQHSSLLLKKYYDKMKMDHDYFGIYFFINPFALICNLDLIKNIFIKDFQYFNDRGMYYNEKDDPLSAHLFNLEGKKWRILRKKLTPTFTSGKMRFMYPTIIQVADEFQKTLMKLITNDVTAERNHSENIEIKELLARFTTDVIGTCAFGIECNSLNDPNAEFRRMGQLVFDKPKNSSITHTFMIVFQELARKLHMTSIRSEVSEFFLKIVKDTMDYREKNNIKRNDFMDLLMQLGKSGKLDSDDGINDETNDDNNFLTFEEIAAQAFVFFLAGFETSSTTMTFSLYELAMNQDIQDKARNEIESVLKKHNGVLVYEALMEMNYIEQIINESLRKYPPGASLLRRTYKDYQIPDTDEIFEKGLNILIPVYAIHHDPEIYPEPEIFNPDRFLPNKIQERHSCAFLPFGEGPRNCIGIRFGMLQARIGLVTLLKNFKFDICEKTKVPLDFSINSVILSSKGGLWLNVKNI